LRKVVETVQGGRPQSAPQLADRASYKMLDISILQTGAMVAVMSEFVGEFKTAPQSRHKVTPRTDFFQRFLD
jgi:hypothetical protein